MKFVFRPILLGILYVCLGVSANTALSMDFISNFKADDFEIWQGDFNNDGKQDLYLKPKKRFLLISVGDIKVPLSFYPHSGYLWSDAFSGGQPHFILWSATASVAGAHKVDYQIQLNDMNQDGRLDLVFSSAHAGLPNFVLYHGQKNQPLTGQALIKGVQYVGTDAGAYPNYNYALLKAYPSGELTPGAVAGASTVSEADGSFRYNMPISVPAGPSGVTPSLSVAYSSTTGNGLMGVGFQLTGLSAISDCRAPYEKEDGSGIKTDFRQQLCLDGVPLVQRGSGSLYPENNPGLVVNPSAGGYVSESLTYERRHYGTSSNARWQVGPRGVHRWRLNRVEDPYGNGYDIDYLDPNSPYPLAQRIRYHNVVIEFSYIPRPFPSTFVYHGQQFVSDKLLKNIHVTVAGKTYRRYHFGYEVAQGAKAVRLQTMIECGADGKCLAPTTFAYEQPQAVGMGFESKAYTLGQQGGICADGKHASAHRYGRCDSPAGDGKNKGYDFDGTGNHGSLQYADANGDGHMDICFRSDQTGVRCQLNDGNHHFDEHHYLASNGGVCDDYGSHKKEQCDNPENFGTITFMDFNKDGKADLVFRGDSWGVTFIPNVNGVFDVHKRYHDSLCDNGRMCDSDNNYFSIRYLNINGDGIPDMCYRADDYGLHCVVSTGIHPVNKTPLYTKEVVLQVSTKRVSQFQVPPLSGVSDADLARRQQMRFCGHGTDYPSYWGGCELDSIRFIDFDKDGLDDLIFVTLEGIKIFRSNGFVPVNQTAGTHYQLFEPYLFSTACRAGTDCFENIDSFKVVDFNSDGWLDICYERDMYPTYRRCEIRTKVSNHEGGGGGRGRRSASEDERVDIFYRKSFIKGMQCDSLVNTTHGTINTGVFPITKEGIIHWKSDATEAPVVPPTAHAVDKKRGAACQVKPGHSLYNANAVVQFPSHIKLTRWLDLDQDGDLDLYIGTDSLREQYFLLEKGRIVKEGFNNLCQQEGGALCSNKNLPSYRFVDFNQDTTPDLVYRSQQGVRLRFASAREANRVNRLNTVNNGSGLVTQVRYKGFEGGVTAQAETRSSINTPGRQRLVVSEVETNTIGGASKLTYDYGQARRDSRRNTFTGFAWVKVTKSVRTPLGHFQPILRTLNQYNVSSQYLSGTLLKQERYALSLVERFPGVFSEHEKLISRTTNQWGLFVNAGYGEQRPTHNQYRRDLYRTAIVSNTSEDFGWIGSLANGRLAQTQTWGAVAKIEQSSQYSANALPHQPRYGQNIALYQLPGSFNGQPVAMEMHQGSRREWDLINHRNHQIHTENQFYPGMRSRLKQTKVTKTYQRLDGRTAQSVKTSAWAYYPNGQMKHEIVEPGHPLSTLTEYQYDPSHGQKTQVRVTGKGLDNTLTYEYDSALRVSKLTNALGHSVHTQYDPIHGLPSQVIDANGLITTTWYDGFGRTKSVHSPNGVVSHTAFEFSKNTLAGSQYRIHTWDNLGNESYQYHAPTGQVIYSKTKGFNDQWIESRTEFDYLSQVKRTQKPAFEGDTALWDEVVQRDYLGATLIAKNAAGHQVSTRSTARYLEETNAKGQQKTTVMDMKGNRYRVFDHQGNELQYLYSPDGQLLALKDVGGGHSIRMQYDLLGNKTQIDDPDKGRIRYTYNAAGQLVLTEQAGTKICQTFDKLGRTLSRHDNYQGDQEQALAGCQGKTHGVITHWQYDTADMGGKPGIGLLHKVTDTQGFSEHYTYDALGQVLTIERTLKGKTYTERFSYDDYGRLDTHTYPSGFKTQNHYQGSYLVSIDNAISQQRYWTLEAMNAAGQITYQKLGNGLGVSHQYDPATALLNLTGANLNGTNSAGELTSASVHAMSFHFDELGNLLKRQDHKAGLTETFRYDDLNRLRGSQVFTDSNAGVPIDFDSVQYYANGNIRFKSDAGFYLYGQQAQGCANKPGPHAVSQLITNGKVRNFCYDARGNMVTDGVRRVTYAKAHDKPIRIQTLNGSTAVDFEYGPDRGRYYRKDSERGQITETYYAGAGYEEVYQGKAVLKKHYIGGNVIEIHRYQQDKLEETEQRYLLKDHLGSIAAVTDAQGQVLERHTYDAWGKKRSLDWRKVTGLNSIPLTPEQPQALPTALMYGDFNGDGQLEFAQAIANPFATANAASNDGYSYYQGDVNGDGHQDLIRQAVGRFILIPVGDLLVPIKQPDELRSEIAYGNDQGKHRFEPLKGAIRWANHDELQALEIDAGIDNSSLDPDLQAQRSHATTRGFTGHEHIESLGLVHMNGRVYDPNLGRFLSADPFVQAPTNTQSPNRYSYVFNNPLSFTDPSGYLAIGGFKIGGVIGQIADQIGFHFAKFDYWMHFDQGIGPQITRAGVQIGACVYGGPGGCVAASAAMSTWLSGDLKQGLKAAIITTVSLSVSGAIGDAGMTVTQAAIAHGVAQGTLAVVGEGRFTWRTFGSAFLAASVGHVAGSYFHSSGVGIETSTFITGVTGGLSSVIAGGSFGDGFVTAATVHLFNAVAHSDSGCMGTACLPDPRRPKAQYVAPDYIDSTGAALTHYLEGNGEPMELGPKTKKAIINNKDQKYRLGRIVSGTTTSLKGRYPVDLTWDVFHVGRTPVTYNVLCANEKCTVTFRAFEGDGFWDPMDLEQIPRIRYGDNSGSKGEFGAPFDYKPYEWEHTFSDPWK